MPITPGGHTFFEQRKADRRVKKVETQVNPIRRLVVDRRRVVQHYSDQLKIAQMRAVLDLAKTALLRASEKDAFSSHEDTVGYRVCCNVRSFLPHDQDCELMKAVSSINKLLYYS